MKSIRYFKAINCDWNGLVLCFQLWFSHKIVYDEHGFVSNSNVWMNLFQNFVNINERTFFFILFSPQSDKRDNLALLGFCYVSG